MVIAMLSDVLNTIGWGVFYVVTFLVSLFLMLVLATITVKVITTAYLTAIEEFHSRKRNPKNNGEPKREA